MKKYLPYIIVSIAAIVLYRVVFSPVNIKTDVDRYENLIKQLEKKVDSLHSKNEVLQFEADSLEERMTEYDKKIKNLNYTINVIKKETKQKVDAVDFFGDDELERFFAERYRQYQDSIN
tara:strand:+ start:385 stop:741 length:357 start_codon:yes stop_codon:yes gene_type:complete